MSVVKAGAALIALCAGQALLADDASAGEWYGKVSIGESSAAIEGIDLNEGLSYGAAIGTSVGPVRVEAGVDHISGDFAGILDAEALVYSGTAYLDLPVGDNASVFVGAGLDYVDGEGSIPGFAIDASGTGYHLAAGGAYRLSPNVIAEAQWRRIEADLEADFIGDVEMEADVLTVGLRLAL